MGYDKCRGKKSECTRYEIHDKVEVTRMARVRNEEVCRRVVIEKEFSGRKGQRVLRWFRHVERWMSIPLLYGETSQSDRPSLMPLSVAGCG